MARRWRIGLVLLVVLAVAAVLSWKQTRPAPEALASAATVEGQGPTVLPRFLDLGSTTCAPCKMMVKVMADLRREYKGQLQVDFIDVTRDPQAAAQYGVRTIPMQIIFDRTGQEVSRHVGYVPTDSVVAELQRMGLVD